jgi:hypothetical protein
MHLTPQRVNSQMKKADKLMRIIWRLYSPHRSHRKKIVKASYFIMEAADILEDLYEEVKKDFAKEMKNPLEKKSIPPGYQK